MIGTEILVNSEKYIVQKFLGKGKSGYSYLVTNGSKKYVYKQIHHEPCKYYNFGNKLMAEVFAYKNLSESGINIPKMIEYNEDKNYLIKEYIDGLTAAELAAENNLPELYIESVFKLAGKLYGQNINVDFFPTNFICLNDEVYYIDYEINEYNEEWDFETCGIYFWLNGGGIKEHLENGKLDKLCLPDSSKPIKENLEEKASELIKKYSRKKEVFKD